MSKINLQAETTNSGEQEEQREKTDMLRSIGKQSGESVESVQKSNQSGLCARKRMGLSAHKGTSVYKIVAKTIQAIDNIGLGIECRAKVVSHDERTPCTSRLCLAHHLKTSTNPKMYKKCCIIVRTGPRHSRYRRKFPDVWTAILRRAT